MNMAERIESLNKNPNMPNGFFVREYGGYQISLVRKLNERLYGEDVVQEHMFGAGVSDGQIIQTARLFASSPLSVVIKSAKS